MQPRWIAEYFIGLINEFKSTDRNTDAESIINAFQILNSFATRVFVEGAMHTATNSDGSSTQVFIVDPERSKRVNENKVSVMCAPLTVIFRDILRETTQQEQPNKSLPSSPAVNATKLQTGNDTGEEVASNSGD